MGITIVFETHSISEDNEREVASGWADPPLSNRGRELARELGGRRRDDGLAAVFSSDLRRARETVEIAFGGTIPVLLDWRLRECDYGALNGGPVAGHVQNRIRYLDQPYPGGESWRQAVARAGRILDDLPSRWDQSRVLIVGHVATCWALEHRLNGLLLETLATSDFAWRQGWEYRLRTTAPQS
jgi:alpha-ribazole phosphatase/probable phosphoglycerate mutase